MQICIVSEMDGQYLSVNEFIYLLNKESRETKHPQDFWAMTCCINGLSKVMLDFNQQAWLIDRCGFSVLIPDAYKIIQMGIDSAGGPDESVSVMGSFGRAMHNAAKSMSKLNFGAAKAMQAEDMKKALMQLQAQNMPKLKPEDIKSIMALQEENSSLLAEKEKELKEGFVRRCGNIVKLKPKDI